MDRYNAQILNDKGEYHLQYETDSRDNFNAVERLVQKCIDNKPQTNFDKITESVESLAEWIENLDTFEFIHFSLKKQKLIEWLQKTCE